MRLVGVAGRLTVRLAAPVGPAAPPELAVRQAVWYPTSLYTRSARSATVHTFQMSCGGPGWPEDEPRSYEARCWLSLRMNETPVAEDYFRDLT